MAHQHDDSNDQPTGFERHCDVAIVGGSAAGLAAALMLVRSARSVIVLDAGEPRNAPAAHMHAFLGHDGRPPAEYLAIARSEVRSYGGEILNQRVTRVEQNSLDGFTVALGDGSRVHSRRVVAATGIVDELPDIEGLAAAWGRQAIHCPYCHGYESRDGRIVVIGTSPMAAHQAALFRQLSSEITLVVHAAGGASDLEELWAAGVKVIEQPVARVEVGETTMVRLADGSVLEADTIVVGPSWRVRAEPFVGLDIVDHPLGLGDIIETNEMGQTNVPGLYAAGNLTDASLQVMLAAAAGSRVGAFVNHDLVSVDLAAGAFRMAASIDWDQRYESDDQIWSGNPNGTLVAEVSDLPAGRALDIGAGEGGDAVWLAEQGWSVTATDVSDIALARGRKVSDERDLDITWVRADLRRDAPEAGIYDLVSLQYPAVPRTADRRELSNLLEAVAPGGTLLAVGHAFTDEQQPAGWDRHAYLMPDLIAGLLDPAAWEVEVNEVRKRPGGHIHEGHAQHHQIDDVVVRARRLT